MTQPLLILGASARAAAFSALRAGLAPQTIDAFADQDLRRRCMAMRAERYPRSLPRQARDAPPGPWMYTGALENHPDLVDRIARERVLYGIAAAVLRRVRQPDELTHALVGAACRYPAHRRSADGLPRDGSWLRKPLRSAGGRHIEVWDHDCRSPTSASGWHFHERVAGLSCSAVFVAAAGRAVLLGVTEQLVGTPWTGASGFRYAGSLGPLNTSDNQHAALVDLGNRLASAFELIGLFGVDLVQTSTDLWLIEVNPRYPASVEVLERALGFSAVGLHVAACRDRSLPAAPSLSSPRWCGKAIFFARREVVISTALASQLAAASQVGNWPPVADTPAAGESLRPGWPILSVLAEAADRSRLLAALEQSVRYWQGIAVA